MSRYYQFSEEEDAFIKANYLSIPRKRMARVMKITTRVLERRYNDLNLVVPEKIKRQFGVSVTSKTGSAVKPFSEKEIQFVRDNCLTMSLNQLATSLGRSKAGVRQVMTRCKIEVPEEIKQQRYIDSLKKKGYIPPNKGKKLPEHIKAKMQKTMFKKGNVPHNVQPIGTERNVNGYVEVKVRDGEGKYNWDLKHRVIWREHYGEIPEGFNIQFKDGNRLNFAIDNLYLSSKSENILKHTWAGPVLAKRFLKFSDEQVEYLKNDNPELLQMIELHYSVKREVNRLTK